MYRRDDLPGGHVIALGPGNEDAALRALRAYPGGLQMGGGMTPQNASRQSYAHPTHKPMTSISVHHQPCIGRSMGRYSVLSCYCISLCADEPASRHGPGRPAHVPAPLTLLHRRPPRRSLVRLVPAFRVVWISESYNFPSRLDFRVVRLSESSGFPSHLAFRVVRLSGSFP